MHEHRARPSRSGRTATTARSTRVQVRGIGGTASQPGASTEPITVRSQRRLHARRHRAPISSPTACSRTSTVKMFAKRSGRIFPLGEFKMDRRIIPHAVKRRPSVSAPSRQHLHHADRADARAATRSARRGRHRRLERHRQRHLLRADPRRRPRADGLGMLGALAARRRARVCRRDGLRRAGGAAAARGRRVRLPARRVRTGRGVSHRLDVVRRRLLRRHRRQRRRARRLHRSLRSGRRRSHAAPDDSDPARRRSSSRRRRSWRSPPSSACRWCTSAASGPAGSSTTSSRR